MSTVKLFCPAEDYKNYIEIKEEEVKTFAEIAKRQNLAFSYNKDQGKAYLGHAPGWKKPTSPDKVKVAIPPGGEKQWKSDGRGYAKVAPLAQHLPDTCGCTSVAIVVNALSDPKLAKISDIYIHDKYGYNLVPALEAELPNYEWSSPNFPVDWLAVEKKLDSGLPVIFSNNGPDFSPSGHGHIMVIYGINGDKVHIADPNGGVARTVTKGQIDNPPFTYPGGNWLIWAEPKKETK